MHERHDDARRVAAARRGSADAARELFDRHWNRAWYTAFAITGAHALADEVAQDAFERAFASLSRFDGRSSFATWLHRIVANRAVDVARRERRRPPEPSAAAAPDEAAADAEVAAAVARLPLERRAVVVLRYWLDLTPAEIAQLLDVPVGTVHSRLARALEQLRTDLEVGHVRAR